jgi:hypothetical protein
MKNPTRKSTSWCLSIVGNGPSIPTSEQVASFVRTLEQEHAMDVTDAVVGTLMKGSAPTRVR